MPLILDANQLYEFDRTLSRVGRVFDKNTSKRILRIALAPAEAAVKREAPEAQRGSVTFRTFSTKRGKIKRDGTYDRGGATKRDVRILMVNPVGDESARGLVGVSKKRGKVGWRTLFLTRGTRNRRTRKGWNRGATRADDFLDRGERQSEYLVEREFENGAEALVRKELKL